MTMFLPLILHLSFGKQSLAAHTLSSYHQIGHGMVGSGLMDYLENNCLLIVNLVLLSHSRWLVRKKTLVVTTVYFLHHQFD
ncbi:hypothetical protein BC833DRAFT_599324 [Globomyces pollinis-pini]|nr:hypothetical protein BC833DRAFT_599324 [Globomyces pollinis-pini]